GGWRGVERGGRGAKSLWRRLQHRESAGSFPGSFGLLPCAGMDQPRHCCAGAADQALSRGWTTGGTLKSLKYGRGAKLKRVHIIIVLAALAGFARAARGQQSSSAFWLGSIATPPTINTPAHSTTPSSIAGQQQNPFLGSVPTGTITDKPIELSLEDAIARGLHYNLGVIENQASLRQAQAERLRSLSTMVPSVSALVRQNLNDLNRVAIGLKIPRLPPAPVAFAFLQPYIPI